MADSIWDVVYGDNRLTNGILGLPDNYSETPKQVLGGGQSIYSPEMDDWETRYDNEGNPYRSRKDVPLHIGHSRDLSLVQPVADVLSQPVEPTVINMTNDQVVQPIQEPSPIQEPTQVFMPNDRVVPAIGEEEPIARNLSAFQEIAKFDEGGARALYDAYQKGDRISDKVFYEWMDKAGIEGVSERPSTQQMLDEIRSINAMEQAQAKERARLEELQRLEQFKPADFDPAEFDARVQRGLDKTPEWLGQSNNILSDAQREQLNTYDTDYFGNPVDTDAFGQSNFDQRQQQYLDSKNRMAFTRSDDAQPDVDMSFLYEGETVSQGKEPEPTFSDDWAGRNQRRTYETQKFVTGLLDKATETLNPLYKDWYNRLSRESQKDIQEYNKSVGVKDPMKANFFTDVAKLTKGTLDAITSPIETADAIASVLSGAIQHALPDEVSWNQDSKDMASMLGQIYANRYGSLDGFSKALAESPAEVIAEVTGIGLITKLGATKLVNKLNSPALLDKIDDLSRQLPETQMSEGFGQSKVFGGSKGAENLGKTGSLDKAERLEKSGSSKDDIWNETGFIRGQDGNWRFELDSSKMKVKDIAHLNKGALTSLKASDIIDYPELFSAYPQLKNLEIRPFDHRLGKNSFGYFAPGKTIDDSYIVLSPEGLGDSMIWKKIGGEWKKVPDTNKSSVFAEKFEHELQHAIQKIEGHATGSSPAMEIVNSLKGNQRYQELQARNTEIEKKGDFEGGKDEYFANLEEIKKIEAEAESSAYSNYMKVAGEAEAYESQGRFGLTGQQRKDTLPTWYGVDDKDAIVRFDDSVALGSTQKSVDDIFSGTWDIPHTKATPITPSVIKQLEDTKSSLAVFNQALKKRKSKFDDSFEDHINASIPGWQDVEMATGNAITKLYGKDHKMLDIGSSEGSFINTISEMSGVKTTGLDPVYTMVQKANSGKNKNTTHVIGAFGDATDSGKFAWYDKSPKLDKDGNPVLKKNGKVKFVEDKNKPVYFFDPKGEKYDVVHEAMTFQFMTPDRGNHFKRVSELLKDDGIFISKEKILIPEDLNILSKLPRYGHKLQEIYKNKYKKQHFTDEQITKKAEEVLEGMAENQVTQKEILNQAKKHFNHVEQIWDSGNFVGYVMGNNKKTVQNYKKAVGDLTSPASSKNVVPFWATNKGVATVGGGGVATGVGLDWVLSPNEEAQAEPTETKKEPMKGVLDGVKTWQPNNNLVNFVKMMENAPLAVGKTGVVAYDDVGHRAKGYGTKAGLLAQDTEAEASKAMIKKLIDANKDVDRLVKIKLNKDERNALVSLIYNIGEGAFAKSKALKALNKGDKKTFVKEAFHPKLGFVKSKGKILKGLVNRRTKEKDIFTKGVYGN